MREEEDELHDPARLLMERQAALADAQLSLVEAELRAHRLGLVRARTGIALRLVLLAFLLLAIGLLAAAIITALRSNRLVVDPFEVPQALSVTGATGEALAASVADELNRLGRQAAEPATASSLPGFRRLFGHDRHIGGSVIGLEDGMFRVTVRGDGVQPRSFTGRAGDLPALATLAARYVQGARAQGPEDRPRSAPAAAPAAAGPTSPAEYRASENWTALAALYGRDDGSPRRAALLAEAEAFRHDHQGARRALLAADPADPLAGSVGDLIAGLRELDLGRADRAIPPLERFDRAVRADPELGRLLAGDRCVLAVAYARIGRTRQALRLLAADPGNVRCAALRGDVFALSGRWREASRAYNDAIALAPSSPVPYERAGAALLARDDPEAAARFFGRAVARAPHWADPHFGLAEAMMQLGRFAEAEQHYRAAAALAPRWGALHVGWGEALWRLGRQQEARNAWAAAAEMDLGSATRTRLQQLLAFVTARPGERAEAQARVSASSADLGRRLVMVTRVPMSVRS